MEIILKKYTSLGVRNTPDGSDIYKTVNKLNKKYFKDNECKLEWYSLSVDKGYVYLLIPNDIYHDFGISYVDDVLEKILKEL